MNRVYESTLARQNNLPLFFIISALNAVKMHTLIVNSTHMHVSATYIWLNSSHLIKNTEHCHFPIPNN